MDENSITIDRIRPLFYQEGSYDPEKGTGRLKWETHDIAYYTGASDIPLPSNKHELRALYNRVRQTIYAIEKLEYEENGRSLVRIKYVKGKPVQYGFSKKRVAIDNDAQRRRIRTVNTNAIYDNFLYRIWAKLTDEQKSELAIDYTAMQKATKH